MQSVIRKVAKDDCADLANILVKAYPSPNGDTEESIAKLAQHLRNDLDKADPIRFYGAFRNGKLLGAVKLYEFIMNFRSVKVRLGGIAGVCVHFLHKKEKVARDLLAFALNDFHAKGIHVASLYPFQTEFYKKMGFGYGTMKHQFRIKPNAFPRGTSKRNIDYLTEADRQDVLACYRRYFEATTGMFERREADLDSMFSFGNTAVGVRQNGEITGHIVFHFKQVIAEYSQKYNLVVSDLIFNTPEALSELCTFLHSQSDQIHQVIITAQDENFFYLFDDPTNGKIDSFETAALESCVTAVGCMYRVLDVRGIFSELSACDFGGVTCKLKITISDDFYESNDGSTIVHFYNGRVHAAEDESFDVAISLNVANFSSLLVGAVRFNSLYNYGLVKLSDPLYREKVDRLFSTDRYPRSDTFF